MKSEIYRFAELHANVREASKKTFPQNSANVYTSSIQSHWLVVGAAFLAPVLLYSKLSQSNYKTYFNKVQC